MIEWGSVGEWVSGLGALGAVGATVVLWLRDRRERMAAQSELREMRAREEVRARMAQALSVHLWARHSDTAGGVYLFLWNGSERPVFDVAAQVSWEGPNGREPLSVRERNLMPTPIRPYRIWLGDQLEQAGYIGKAPLTVEGVEFTDSIGLRWRLGPDGTLFEELGGGWQMVRRGRREPTTI
jgi:hypothetical protein